MPLFLFQMPNAPVAPAQLPAQVKIGRLWFFLSGLCWLVNRVCAVGPADVIFLFLFVYCSFLFLFFFPCFLKCFVMFYVFHAFKAAAGKPLSSTSQVKGYILKKGDWGWFLFFLFFFSSCSISSFSLFLFFFRFLLYFFRVLFLPLFVDRVW